MVRQEVFRHRESAYEMLNKKIETVEKAAEEQQQQETEEKEDKKTSETTGAITKSVVKVLTSATFIRGAFGILSKIFKK